MAGHLLKRLLIGSVLAGLVFAGAVWGEEAADPQFRQLPPPGSRASESADPTPPHVEAREKSDAPADDVPQESPQPDQPELIPPGAKQQERLKIVEFRDLSLGEAMRLFSEQTGLNVVPSDKAAKKMVSLYLRNVTAGAALDAVCKANDLWVQTDKDSGVIHISTTEEYTHGLASFRDEKTHVFTLLYPNPVDVARTIESIYGDRVMLTLPDQQRDPLYQQLEKRFERFDLIDERSEGQGLFGATGTGVSQRSSTTGRSSSSGQGYGRSRGQDFLRDVRSRRGREEKARKLPRLEEFEDLTTEEIEVLEAYFAGQDRAVDQAVIDELMRRRRATIYVTIIPRNNQLIIRTGDEKTMKQISDLIRRLDVPTPLVLLEVKILSVVLDDDFHSVFDYQFSDGATTAGGFTTGNILPPLSDTPPPLVPPLTRRHSSIAPASASVWDGAGSEDLTFQFVNDNFRFRMQLLETKNRITTLATPLLLTANNEVSRIFIGETLPFTIGFKAPEVVSSTTVPVTIAGTPITELRDVGQSLLITPSINADRTVALRIAQQSSRVHENGATIPVLDTGGAVSYAAVDTVNRTTVSGTIVAKDGLTVALGGLIEEGATDQRSEVPIVGKLPVIGFFFRRQETTRERRELVILVRPYVFNTPCESAVVSEQIVRDVSVHPNAYNGDNMLRSHSPWEVVRPDAPVNQCQNTFRFHSVQPKRY